MQIANGIEMLEISADVMGKTDTIHPVLIYDEETAVLTDTGYPGQMSKIVEAMEQAGVSFKKLNKIIITHQDLDHIGSLPVLLQEAPQPIEVFAHPIEQPYIEGVKRLLKITDESIARAMDALPADVPEAWRNAFKATLENPPKGVVNYTVSGGEELPYCGGIVVIETPGHTPGHISLYHKPSKTLVAADALIVSGGELHGPVPEYSIDIKLAVQSIKKLTQYNIEYVICYHGGLYRGKANERIAQLAGKFTL